MLCHNLADFLFLTYESFNIHLVKLLVFSCLLSLESPIFQGFDKYPLTF